MKGKVFSLTMALVLVCALFGVVLNKAPVSAGTLSWTGEESPATLVENTLAPPGVDIVDLAANGDTVFAATNDTNFPLYKSTDGGATWSSLAYSTSFPSGVSVKHVAIAADNVSMVAIVTSAEEIEYSTNGGASWTDLGLPAIDAAVNAIDVSSAVAGYHYVAAGGGNSTSAELWTIKVAVAEAWVARAGNPGFAANQDWIEAVKFSPNFASDRIITCVSSNTTFQVFRCETGLYTWNGQIDFFDAIDWGSGIQLDTLAEGLASASIALPSTYLGTNDAERIAFVSLAGVTTGGGAWRLTDYITKEFKTWASDTVGAINSVAYHESGMLLAGDYDEARVYTCLSPMADNLTFERQKTLKQPGGTTGTVVAWAGDTAAAGTSGDESAFAVSTDYGSAFNDIGLIDTELSVMSDVAVSANGTKVYLATYDTAEGTGMYDVSIWLKRTSWTRVFSIRDVADTSASFLVRIARGDDSAVYIASKTTQDIWRSRDSGSDNWTHAPCVKVTGVQDFVVASANVVYVLDTATGQGVSKTTNTGVTWGSTKEPVEGISGHMLTLTPNGDVLVGGSDGYVAYSKDGGLTFERTKSVGTGNIHVVADKDYADNNIIYVGVVTSVKRGMADTTSNWRTRGYLDTGYSVYGMGRIENVVYVLASDGTDSILYRALNLKTAGTADLAGWSSITATGETYMVMPKALKISSGPNLWAIDTTSPALESCRDPIATVSPTLVSPAEGFQNPVNSITGRAYNVAFTWQRYPASRITGMQLEIAVDPDFYGIVYSMAFVDIDTDTITKVVGPTGAVMQQYEFMPGTTYYWRVRTTEPLLSPWSEIRSFGVESLDGVPGVRVSIDAPDWVPGGYDFTVTVDINQVTNFDACNYDVTFDPAVLRADNVTSGQINGTTIPVSAWSENVTGTVTIVQNVGGFPGVSGSGHLAVLHFQAIGSIGDTSALDLKNGIISNNLAEEITAVWVDDSVYISFFVMGDANGDGEVNALDITKVERIIAGLD